MNKKYELTNESIEYINRTLYRIRALRDFGDVKAGDLGGFVESERNLSHDGDCWIYDDAIAMDMSHVRTNARMRHESIAGGHSEIFWCAELRENTIVTDSAKIGGNAVVGGNSVVGGTTVVEWRATVGGYAHLLGDTRLHWLANVFSNKHFITISGIGLDRGTLSAYVCSNGKIGVSTSCFRGYIDEFIDEMKHEGGYNDYMEQYLAAVNLIRLTLKPECHTD